MLFYAKKVPKNVTETLTRDEDHKYWIVKENILGVSEVMEDVGLQTGKWFTETDSSRGVAIHGELANIANGAEPFDFLDLDLYGWVKSGRDFLDYLIADGAVILKVELMTFHPIYRFAGTCDLIVLWRGYEWVLDWKSGKASKVTRFKLAAYDLLLGSTKNGKPRKRAAIELKKDGRRAKLVEYNGVEFFNDGSRFLAYLTTARDLKTFGPNKE